MTSAPAHRTTQTTAKRQPLDQPRSRPTESPARLLAPHLSSARNRSRDSGSEQRRSRREERARARCRRNAGTVRTQPRRLLGPLGTGSQQMRRPPPREERRRRGSLSRRCRVGTAAARSTAWCRTAASPGESGSDAGVFASFRGFGGSALGRCCVVRLGLRQSHATVLRRFALRLLAVCAVLLRFFRSSWVRRKPENRMLAAISLSCVRRVSSGDGGN